jgi:hypothetical protein
MRKETVVYPRQDEQTRDLHLPPTLPLRLSPSLSQLVHLSIQHTINSYLRSRRID